MSTESKRYSIVVMGRVQGVGYRFFTKETADRYGISGWVRNCFNGDVEIEAQAHRELLNQFIKELKKGPPTGNVAEIHTREIEVVDKEQLFKITF